MSVHEYHRHASGDVVQGCAARCIDPDAGAEDVSVLNANETARVLKAHQHAWANFLEEWDAAVGPVRPTVPAVIEALRANFLPFGCTTTTTTEASA